MPVFAENSSPPRQRSQVNPDIGACREGHRTVDAMNGGNHIIFHRLRKIVLGAMISSCLYGLSAVGCSMTGEPSCDPLGGDCTSQSFDLEAGTEFPLKTVAIS